VLEYTDEPFADSSALAVYILSKETRKHVTVALSGDGADELLAGYNKHAAAYRMLHPGWKETAVTSLQGLWKILPKSRNNAVTNKVRQLARFSEGSALSSRDRYWRWAAYADQADARALLHPDLRTAAGLEDFGPRRENLLRNLPEKETINDILLTDMQLVLSNDMLTKVDLMSMANGLEVRVPFLDYQVVDFLFSLPDSYKINGHIRKRILQDAFRDVLPEVLYNRPKKGFEVPLLKWFRREMKSLITDDLLSEKFVTAQGIFHYPVIHSLKQQLFSNNPGDVHARIWGLLVFQAWWKKYAGAP
jgi:asparagine synthase (glutamine-hydrolysing)